MKHWRNVGTTHNQSKWRKNLQIKGVGNTRVRERTNKKYECRILISIK